MLGCFFELMFLENHGKVTSWSCWFLLGRYDLNEASIFTVGRENAEVWVSDFIPGSLGASMN